AWRRSGRVTWRAPRPADRGGWGVRRGAPAAEAARSRPAPTGRPPALSLPQDGQSQPRGTRGPDRTTPGRTTAASCLLGRPPLGVDGCGAARRVVSTARKPGPAAP